MNTTAMTRRNALVGVCATAIPIAAIPKNAPASPLDREELKLLALGTQLLDLLDKERPLRAEKDRCGVLKDEREAQELPGHWLEHREAAERIGRETGYRAAWDAWNAFCVQVWATAEAIDEIQPKTLEGLAVRLLAMMWTKEDHQAVEVLLETLRMVESLSARQASRS